MTAKALATASAALRDRLEQQGLPRLTGRRYRFVLLVASGHTYSDAYRKAFSAQNMAETTIWPEASRLTRHPKVSAWLAYFDRQRAEAVVSTLSQDMIIADLLNSREEAKANRQYAAVMRANELVGKHLGMWLEGQPDGAVRALENATIADLQKMLGKLDQAQKALPVIDDPDTIDVEEQ